MNATEINKTRAAYLTARALVEQLHEELNAQHPQDDEAGIDAWEDAYLASGGYALADALRAAKVALLRAGRAWTESTGAQNAEALVAYDYALGENGRRWNPAAAEKLLDLLCRLDTRTV